MAHYRCYFLAHSGSFYRDFALKPLHVRAQGDPCYLPIVLLAPEV